MSNETSLVPDDDRDRGILTPADRKFLKGKKEYSSEQSERDARYRIRNRVRNAVLDFSILLHHMSRRDREQVFDWYSRREERSNRDSDSLRSDFESLVEKSMFVNGVSDTVGYLYLGVEDAGEPFEETVESGIEHAEEEKGYVVENVSVDIKISREAPDIDELIEKIESGEPLEDDELRALIQSGEIELNEEVLDSIFEQMADGLSDLLENGDVNINRDE